MSATTTPDYHLEIETPSNGRARASTVRAIGADGKQLDEDRADLSKAAERKKMAGRMAEKLGKDPAEMLARIEKKWNEVQDEYRQFKKQAEAGSPEAAAVETLTVLNAAAKVIRRPLTLMDGCSYAAAWCQVERAVTRDADGRKYDPPLVTVEEVLLVVAGDGQLYADRPVLGARPLAELGVPVRLPSALPPGRGWSGAGVKAYVARERPDPAEVFQRVVSVVNRFIDFARSLTSQEVMCELVACYVLGTYFLEALHVTGYLWPNGERGTGKTSFLQVVAELAYIGQVILAGSTYACLRDMADYGATLAFDDAEAVMDTRRTDPDKRTLLLAGNRRGATVAVKELEGDRWVMRHVNTFCPRLFSAIRLPDEVLGSRSIIVPLVRSGDPRRAKANCLDPEDWPCDRRRLVDDLWAVGLTHLPELGAHDREAADATTLSGRNLDPWRPILAVAHWLQEQHGLDELFQRLEKLAVTYQQVERGEYEDADRTRVLFRALLELCEDMGPEEELTILPCEVADRMNALARDEDLVEGDKSFTSARKVGHLLKRQRFRRPERTSSSRGWLATRQEVEDAARAYGVEPEERTEDDAEEDEVPF
jgi:hypothetical protein